MSQSSDPVATVLVASAGLATGVLVGRLTEASLPGHLYVDYPGNALGPLPARTTLQLSADNIEQAVQTGQGALLLFENGLGHLPIVVGLIQAAEESPFRALLVQGREPTAALTRAPEARLDGERLVLEAEREIVLECGDASLTLRRDGKVLIRGAYVETHAKGTNRIKGGAVKIN